jgi:hypothetical protein
MFNQALCDRCGDCLVRCLYVSYDKERAAFEIGGLIAGRSAPIPIELARMALGELPIPALGS